MNKRLFVFMAIVMAVLLGCNKEPTAPTNLNVEADDEGYFHVSWDTDVGADDRVYRSEGDGDPEYYADPSYNSKFYDHEIELGKTYNYQIVRYEDSAATDLKSEIVTLICEDLEARVKNMEIAQDGMDAIITWDVYFLDNLPEGAYIEVSRKKNDDYDYKKVETVTEISDENTYVDKMILFAGDFVKYKLELFDADGNSLHDEEESISVDHNYSLTPTNVQASISNRSKQEIKVSWDPAKDAEEYYLKIFVKNNTPFVLDPVPASSTSAIVTISETLNEGDVLSIQVGGKKGDYRDYSEEVDVTW